MKAVSKTPASILSAPTGLYVIAMIGGDGCAAGLDDSAPPMALAAGTVLLVSPEQSLRLVWGRTCGWSVWSVDASLVQRAARRADLTRLLGPRAAAVSDHGAVRDLVTALSFESRRAHPAQRLLVQSLADALPRDVLARHMPTRHVAA